MLRLSPDRLVMALAPGCVTWAVVRRGLSNRLHAKGLAKFSLQEGPSWQQAMHVLQSELPKLPVTSGKVKLVLSNAFVRYLLVNGGEVLSCEEDRLALAKHDFLMVYGGLAQGWEIRVGVPDNGGKFLASAVDAELIGNLRQIFSTSGFTLDSIQPYFAQAFDAWCTSLDSKSSHGIFLAETGGYCYAGIGMDAWEFIRCGRWEEDDPADTFHRVIGREASLSGAGQRELWKCHAPDELLADELSDIHQAKFLPEGEAMLNLDEPEYALVWAGVA